MYTSTTMNGEKPPLTILMLPDDLVLNCLARVSRLYYPTLSLVSKRLRHLIASTELYQVRTLLGRTESCLYVCLRHCTDSYPLCWFTLCQRPYSSKKTLVLVPSPPSLSGSEVAVVGPNIHTTGGFSNRNASSRVMVMDCRSHKWLEAPSMQLARVFHSACVLDEKIYVTGGCENLDPTNWMEIFDTKTQTWDFLQIRSEEICGGSRYKSIGYEGAVYIRSEGKDATYKLHKGRWRGGDLAINYRWDHSSAHCVIENVFYSYFSGRIDWYDSKNRSWTALKGLETLPSLSLSGYVILADYGGKIAVLWEEYVSIKERKIWCAEIAIEKRQNGEIWGILD